MHYQEADNILAVRVRDWSLQDLLREMRAGCPLLSTVKLNMRLAGGFVDWNKEMPDAFRPTIAEAMNYLGHAIAIRKFGIPVSVEAEMWSKKCDEEISKRQYRLPPLPYSDTNQPTFRRVDGYKAMELLCDNLNESFGEWRRAGYVVTCRRKFGDWKIVTTFRFEKRYPVISFQYEIKRKDMPKVREVMPYLYPRNLLLMYGIYGLSQISVPSEHDGTAMPPVIVHLAEHFLLHIDGLLADLGIDD